MVLLVMCWVSFVFRVSVVRPINWLFWVHLLHSSKQTTFLVRQQVYFWVGNVLLLVVEVILHFLDMIMQHLQLGVPQGIELPSPDFVALITIGSVDTGGSRYCFSLALTSFFAILSVLVRLRHGLGTLSFSL